MNKFSAVHVQRGSHVTGAEESSWNASSRPARSTDAEISFGTPVHGLPAFTDGVVFQRQPRPARHLCPPIAIVSVFQCLRGSHVGAAHMSVTPRYHSEHQCTACPLQLTPIFRNCPHHDSIISCGALAYGLVSESLGPKKTFVKKVDSLGSLGCAHLEIRLVGLAKFVGGSVKLS